MYESSLIPFSEMKREVDFKTHAEYMAVGLAVIGCGVALPVVGIGGVVV